MPGSYLLPAILDLRAAAALKAELEARRGAALDLDASKVERLGGLCLQVLAAASAAWRAAGHAFRVTEAGEAFRNDVRLMGAEALVTVPVTVEGGSEQPC